MQVWQLLRYNTGDKKRTDDTSTAVGGDAKADLSKASEDTGGFPDPPPVGGDAKADFLKASEDTGGFPDPPPPGGGDVAAGGVDQSGDTTSDESEDDFIVPDNGMTEFEEEGLEMELNNLRQGRMTSKMGQLAGVMEPLTQEQLEAAMTAEPEESEEEEDSDLATESEEEPEPKLPPPPKKRKPRTCRECGCVGPHPGKKAKVTPANQKQVNCSKLRRNQK